MIRNIILLCIEFEFSFAFLFLCFILFLILEDNRICKVVEEDPQNYWVPHKDCNKFYMCQKLGPGKWKAHEFQCGPKTGWDDQIKTCNWLRNIKKKNKACNGINCTIFIKKDLNSLKDILHR